MDYFTLFSLPKQFSVDNDALTRRYFIMQQQFHPDRAASLPEAQRIASLQQSMQLNDAYHILKSPLKRAEYLLQLSGIKVGTEQDTVKPEQALLVEAMENREQLMEAGTIDAIQAVEIAATVQKDAAVTQFEAYYQASNFAAAAQAALRWRYALKLLEEAKTKRSRITPNI
jgi:molecular chaperone HscB